MRVLDRHHSVAEDVFQKVNLLREVVHEQLAPAGDSKNSYLLREVVHEQLALDGGAHQDQAKVSADAALLQQFQHQENEVRLDRALVHLVQNQVRKPPDLGGIRHQQLQEIPRGHEQEPRLAPLEGRVAAEPYVVGLCRLGDVCRWGTKIGTLPVRADNPSRSVPTTLIVPPPPRP